MALTPVPITEARPTFLRGFFTRLAVMAATSTPMKENSATAAAMPMQLYKLPPEALNVCSFGCATQKRDSSPRRRTEAAGSSSSSTQVAASGTSRHLPHPGQVQRSGHPQAQQRDAPVGEARGVAEAEQRVDVEHPRASI